VKLQEIDYEVSVPPLYSQHGTRNPRVHARFHLPGSRLVWYAVEGSPDGDDFNFFGYALHPFPKPCFFLLSELKRVERNTGTNILVEIGFDPIPLSEAQGVLSAL